MPIKNFIVLWDFYSDQAGHVGHQIFGLSIKTSERSVIHRNFTWEAVLKIFGIVSITNSFGNQATNFPTVLLRSIIDVLNMFEQWVGEMQNLSARSSSKSPRRSLINTSKNSSLYCNFLFFFELVNFEFEKWCAIVLAWVVCLRGWRVSVGDVLACVA